MAIYARLENGTYAEVTGVHKTDGTEVTEIFQGDRLVYSATNEIYGTLPLYYSGRGFELIDYLISGNAVQDGTPSADAPVDAAGSGAWDEAQQSYKLPLTVNGTEYPIYLGTVPTTRRVKKLVLTGEESWNKSDRYVGSFYAYLSAVASDAMPYSPIVCTHASNNTGAYQYGNGRIDNNSLSLWLFDSAMTVSAFKSYLASQYAAGTPVTVWYVFAEPETGIVNEPLMKIGDYADTVSFEQAGVTIPTVSGANVLDMSSPVKPSEVYIKAKGIKPMGYGQLTDVNNVSILDKNGRPIYVHGQ